MSDKAALGLQVSYFASCHPCDEHLSCWLIRIARKVLEALRSLRDDAQSSNLDSAFSGGKQMRPPRKPLNKTSFARIRRET